MRTTLKHISQFIGNSMYAYAVQRKHPVILALLFFLYNKRPLLFDRFIQRGSRKRKYVIYIGRQIFNFDIKLLQDHTDDIIYLQLSARTCKDVLVSYFPPPISLTDENYCREVSSNYIIDAQLLCNFWEQFFRTLKRFRAVDCVMNHNWVYALSYELNRACLNVNIPYVVYYKESIKSDRGNEETVNTTFPGVSFLGTKILFVSEAARRIYSTVPGISAENSETVGFLRLDRLKKYEEAVKNPSYTISLFIDDPIAYLRRWPVGYDKDQCKENIELVYSSFLQLAANRSKDLFVIKLKGKKSEGYLIDFLKRHNLKLTDNISVVRSGDPVEIIFQSAAVIAFGSTVALEAIALNVPVIEPYTVPKDDPILIFGNFSGIVNYVSNIDELAEVITESERYIAPGNVRLEVLEHYFGFIDGQNTSRVTRVLLREMS